MSTAVPPRPSQASMRRMLAVLAPMRRWVDPKVSGLENLPSDRGCLIVGNHSLYGVYDLLIATELYRRTGVIARGLFDHDHLRIPVWRDALRAIGTPARMNGIGARGPHRLVSRIVHLRPS